MVGTVNQSTNKPSDAAVVKVKGSDKSLALTVDCNSRYIFADPEKGASIAVAEAARNITCTGGTPSAITNCLNFGNPYNPEVYWQFVGSIKGMGAACLKFETPVTGGNVSFYNQSTIDGTAVFPTPTIGMVGIIEKGSSPMTLDFKNEGDIIVLIGQNRNDISSSQYLAYWHKQNFSPAPYFDLDEEFAMQSTLRKLIQSGKVQSAHDVSEGGLFISLLESAMYNNLGFEMTTDANLRKDAVLFGEGQSRVAISCRPQDLAAIEADLKAANQAYTVIGKVNDGKVLVDGEFFGMTAEFKETYNTSIEKMVEGTSVAI
jgi:phosphoribosylformylglycinamidine synthase subunit PurL